MNKATFEEPYYQVYREEQTKLKNWSRMNEFSNECPICKTFIRSFLYAVILYYMKLLFL